MDGWMDGWTNGRNGLILWSWGERLDRVGQVGEALHTHLFFIIINIVIIIILFSFIPLNFVWMDGGKGLTLSTFSYDISSRYGPTYAGVKGVCVCMVTQKKAGYLVVLVGCGVLVGGRERGGRVVRVVRRRGESRGW